MRDNLEHGWIVNHNEDCAEEIGYCEFCERTLYSDDYYSFQGGVYVCEDCKRKIEEGEEEND